MQSLALRVGQLTKKTRRSLPRGAGGNAEVLNWTVHKYFSQLTITNSDPTKQATPMAYEFRYDPVMVDQYIYHSLYHKMERRIQFEAY